MDTLGHIRVVLRDALQIGERAMQLTEDSRLLGGMAEFDSMAVVTVVTMLEERFGFTVDDDELSAEVFETVGSLRGFIDRKLET